MSIAIYAFTFHDIYFIFSYQCFRRLNSIYSQCYSMIFNLKNQPDKFPNSLLDGITSAKYFDVLNKCFGRLYRKRPRQKCQRRQVGSLPPAYVEDAIRLTPNSGVGNGRREGFRGAHASRTRFSASRRKPRSPHFFPPAIPESAGTKVRARRPNSHAGRVCSPFLFQSSG